MKIPLTFGPSVTNASGVAPLTRIGAVFTKTKCKKFALKGRRKKSALQKCVYSMSLICDPLKVFSI